jgi:hypothetical protein
LVSLEVEISNYLLNRMNISLNFYRLYGWMFYLGVRFLL